MSTHEAAVTDITESRCEKDHAEWRREIEAWRRDHKRALEVLTEAAEFIRRHDAELEEHLGQIESHSERHRSGAGPVSEVRARHLGVGRRHNLFRGRHRGLIDEVTRLRVALHKAAHGRVFE